MSKSTSHPTPEEIRRRMERPADGKEPEPRRAGDADGNALHRGYPDSTAGGEDSSPHETVPSGEKKDSARQPQAREG